MPKPSYLMFLTAFNGLSAVVLGAFGAHGLHDTLVARGRLEAWQTAANYQLIHAAAGLAALAWAASRSREGKRLHFAAASWLIGSLLFSGSIYVLALGGPRSLGPVTPLGGLAFMAGWLSLVVESLRTPTNHAS